MKGSPALLFVYDPREPARYCVGTRIDALWWAYLICWGDPVDARARAMIATELLELGAIP